MTVTIKRKVEIEVEISIDENGFVQRARMPDSIEFTKTTRAYLDLPATRAELVEEYRKATRSRLDEGYIRLWASSLHGRFAHYLKIGKLTPTLVVTESGRKYKRKNGNEVGVRYGREWLDKDDLKELSVRDGAKTSTPRKKR